MRSDSSVRGAIDGNGLPKKGSSWASIVDASSDDTDVAGRTIIVDAADADAFIPIVTIDNVNAAGRPKMGLFLAEKTRSVDSKITAAITGSGIPKKGPFRALVADAEAIEADVTGKSRSADSGATSSDLQDYVPPVSVPGRFENGFRPKVSILGLRGGVFPPILSSSGSGIEGLGMYIGGAAAVKQSGDPIAVTNIVRKADPGVIYLDL